MDVFRWLCTKLVQGAPGTKLNVQKYGTQVWTEVPLDISLLLEGSLFWPTARRIRSQAETEWNFMKASKEWSPFIQSAFDKPCVVDLVAYAFAKGKMGYLCHDSVLSIITQIADAVDRNVISMGSPLESVRQTTHRTSRLLRVHQREQLCLAAMELWGKEGDEDMLRMHLSFVLQARQCIHIVI